MGASVGVIRYGHTTSTARHPVRSGVEPGYYYGRGPRGKSWYCSFLVHLFLVTLQQRRRRNACNTASDVRSHSCIAQRILKKSCAPASVTLFPNIWASTLTYNHEVSQPSTGTCLGNFTTRSQLNGWWMMISVAVELVEVNTGMFHMSTASIRW